LNVITRFQLFDRDNNLFQSSTFTDIILNPNLSQDLFKKFWRESGTADDGALLRLF